MSANGNNFNNRRGGGGIPGRGGNRLKNTTGLSVNQRAVQQVNQANSLKHTAPRSSNSQTSGPVNSPYQSSSRPKKRKVYHVTKGEQLKSLLVKLALLAIAGAAIYGLVQFTISMEITKIPKPPLGGDF